MSDNPVDMHDGAHERATQLLARAAAGEAYAWRALGTAIDDFFLPEADRLDERVRTALAALLTQLIDAVEGAIRGHASRLLATRGDAALADALGSGAPVAQALLVKAGVLRDRALMRELLARVRQDLLATAAPALAPAPLRGAIAEPAGLVNRLALHRDRVLAASALAVIVADGRRRGGPDAAPLTQTDLPAELHHRLTWWIAAALRSAHAARAGTALPALDRALCEAAQRSLAAHDEGDRLEAAAMRLATAIDAPPDELPDLMIAALADRQIALVAALIAHRLGIALEAARDLLLAADADRLWLALRALGMSRQWIARLGYAICEADPRRDLEAFADALDGVAVIPVETARATFATLTLDPDYRAALDAIDGDGRS